MGVGSMQQSVSRVSRGGTFLKVAVSALIGLAGLAAVGVQQAAAAAPPVVTSLSVTAGPASGGTAVQVNGTGFGSVGSVTAVYFGTASATFTQVNGIRIDATSPYTTSSSPTVNVTVVSKGVTSATSAADQFTYTWPSPPTVSGISPASGPIAGGTTVTVTGTNLPGASAVHFGTAAATPTVTSATTLTVVAPAGTGNQPVTVTTPNSTSIDADGAFFTYLTTPTVTGIRTVSNPAGGPTGGGTQVTIDGTSFTSDATVDFGTTAATSVLVNSLYSITATAPAGSGAVDVTVHTADGTSATSSADLYTYSSTLAAATGNAGYSTGAQSPSPATATNATQSGTTATITSVGTWYVGETVYLTGFSNGLTSGVYPVTVGGNGSFGIPYTTAVGAFVAGSVITYQTNSFNAASLVTGGTTIDPTTLTVVTPPASGTLAVSSGQLLYTPAQSTPTGSGTTWSQTVTTTGTQTATVAICETGDTWTGNPSTGCTEATINYVPSETGYYMGEQITALSTLIVSVVEDTGGSVIAPASAASGSTFSTTTAPPPAQLPASNSGFDVLSVGGYESITPVPTGLTLVPGSLHVTGGDAATAGKFIASLCTAAMGYVAGECTANLSGGNYHVSYPYIETSLNAATQIPGGTLITLPAVTAEWQVTATSGSTVSSYETEFGVSTNVAQPVGPQVLDTYPSNLASYNDQGLNAPVPTYSPPEARWSVNITAGTPTPTVTGVAPASGSTAGSTPVVITGTNLTGASAVTFGGVAATAYSVVNSTTVDATTPGGTAGAVNVSVTTPGGTGTDANGFTYVAAPTVTGVAPASGSTAGSTPVVIAGTNLTGASAVTFGGVAATGYSVVNSTTVDATTPGGTAGAVNVSVTTPGGTGTDTNGFTYVAAPTVTGVAPASGSTAGSTPVVITGTNLTGASAVTFGGVAATAYSVVNSTTVDATTPGGTAGAVNVSVTTPGGTGTDTNGFTYTTPTLPTVTGVAPASGPTAGSTPVVITGTNLTGASAVTFGGVAATAYSVVNSTTVDATTPGGTAGAVDVSVTTPGGTGTDANGFTYVAAPTVTGVAPASGPTAGSTPVVITGTNLTGASAVTFGGVAATGYSVVNSTTVDATTPGGTAGAVNVSVTTPGGTGTDTNGFTYVAAPTVTGVAPASGPTAGSTPVVITGTNLTGASAVTFGGVAATGYSVVNSTTVDATTPGGTAGAVNVSVTTPGGTGTDTNGFTYVAAPTVTGVAPASGPTAGSTPVVITGTNLTGASAVTFGGVAATGYSVVNSTTVDATTPGGTAGAVNVSVTTPGGTGTDTNGFTYVAAPTVTGVAPASGSTAGSTPVVITGTNLTGASAVTFGGVAATAYSVVNSTTVDATTPGGTAGAVNVSVTTPGGTGTDTNGFTYTTPTPTPTVTGVAPATGPTAGSTPVVITGTNLTGASAVTFGGVAATAYSVVNSTTVDATTPGGTAGAVNVSVTTPGGTGTDTNGFTYTGLGTVIIHWATPKPISYGVALSGVQLDATATTAGGTVVPGTFDYAPGAGSVLPVGLHTLSVTFTPSDQGDYPVTEDTVQLQVNQLVPTLNWVRPKAITYGTALGALQLNAGASVAGTFTYTPGPGSFPPGGTDTLSATFTPANPNYAVATVTTTIKVKKGSSSVSLVITNPSVAYGAEGAAGFQVSVRGANGAPGVGSVLVKSGSHTLCTATLTGPGAGICTLGATQLRVGTYSISAQVLANASLKSSRSTAMTLVVT